MSTATPPGELGSITYDVRENDDRRHAATIVGSSGSWIASASILVAGILLPVIAIYRNNWPILPVGIVFIIAGVWMLRQAREKSKRRLTVVEVSSNGMILRFSDGTTRTYLWRDPALKVRLIDYSAATGAAPPGFRGFGAIPCAIIVGTGPVGISVEALKRIRQTARAAGVAVVDGIPDAFSRTVYLGDWPDVPRPFSAGDPYA
jgi:hypothetical protein